MSETSWSRVADVLGRVLDLPTDQRTEILDAACRRDDGTTDDALRREVEALLAASDAADLDGLLVSPVRALVTPTDDVAPGDAVGPWRLTGLLGEGGMGVVYAAERADGLYERQVALKRLRSGPGRRQLAARLRAERQTLARLEHVGIARLYDGGVGDDGVPFLVMERVEGVPITEWAARVEGRERVQVFVEVCRAVAYAHSRLVVHRDLKPSNVFVVGGVRDERGRGDGGEASSSPHPASFDSSPSVKLLDFGIAKLLDADADETAGGAMTPAYAAPEQLGRGEVTTATDVYSLGMILFEMLAGQRPYDLSSATAAEAERIVRETVPSAPSDSGAGDRDLDAIVAKALDKEPARRYLTADALADDLVRWLGGLPVEARPTTTAYRIGRFVRRHRAAVVASALAVLTLLGATSAALWQAREASRERDRTAQALERSEGTLRYLESSILMGDPQSAEEDPRLSVVLDSAAARVDAEADPAVAAAVHRALANVYLGRGAPDRAAFHAERAARTLEADGGIDYAAAQVAWGQALADGGDPEAALPHHRASLAALDGQTGTDAEAMRASALNVYGATLYALDRAEQAEARYQQAAEIARRVGETYIETTALQNLASLFTTDERFGEAVTIYRRLIVATQSSDDPYASYTLPFARIGLANALSNDGQSEEALTAYRQAVPTFEARLGADHAETTAARLSYAFHLHKMGRFSQASRIASAALATAETTLPEGHPYLSYAQNVAGTARCDAGDPTTGARLLRASLDARRAMLPPDHWILANGESLLGGCLARLGQRAEAHRLLARGADGLEATFGADHQRTRDARARLAAFERGS